MVAPGAGFLVVAPFIGKEQKKKKKGLRCKTSRFSVRKYVMTKKKGLCLLNSGFSVSKEKKTNKWCHSKMVTPGRPPPPPPPLAAPLIYIYTVY